MWKIRNEKREIENSKQQQIQMFQYLQSIISIVRK